MKSASAWDALESSARSSANLAFSDHGLSALDYALHLKLDGYHTMFAVFYRHKVHDDHRAHKHHL